MFHEIAAIDACAAAIAQSADSPVKEERPKEDSGQWGWVFLGIGYLSECRIVYHTDRPGMVQVCLRALGNVPDWTGKERQVAAIAARHGVELGGAISGEVGLTSSPLRVGLWWGVHQTVSVGELSSDLFFAILPRLKAAMQELTPVVSALKAEASESSSGQSSD
jgi:hypothetical protein